MGYGDDWRDHRKMFHEHFNAHAIMKYGPEFPRAMQATLLRLLEHPNDFMQHLRLCVLVCSIDSTS